MHKPTVLWASVKKGVTATKDFVVTTTNGIVKGSKNNDKTSENKVLCKFEEKFCLCKVNSIVVILQHNIIIYFTNKFLCIKHII